MRIDVVTLFPPFFEAIISGSILGRAQAKGLATIAIHDLRAFVPVGERADDSPYGGGPGMVLRLGPLTACMEQLLGPELHVPPGTQVKVASPAGRRFDHACAQQLAQSERLIFVCGHYEGIDNRFFDLIQAEELSLGDFVLTGGEIPVLAFVDACVRLIPGVIAAESAADDSISVELLESPHYTYFAASRCPRCCSAGTTDASYSGAKSKRARERKPAARTSSD